MAKSQKTWMREKKNFAYDLSGLIFCSRDVLKNFMGGSILRHSALRALKKRNFVSIIRDREQYHLINYKSKD